MKKNKIFIGSILLNVIFIAVLFTFVVHKGGFNYVKSKLGIVSASAKSKLNDPLIIVKEEAMTITDTRHRDVVFLGDSHTDYFEWGEYFPETTVSNQGIAGDTSKNVLKRLDNVNAVSPKKIFILIGINDLQSGTNVDKVASNYKKIIDTLRISNPKTKIYIQSVLGVNKEKYPVYFNKEAQQVNDKVDELNQKIERLASNDNYVIYINNSFLQKNGELPADFTVDGLHLNNKGYKLWAENLSKYVNM